MRLMAEHAERQAEEWSRYVAAQSSPGRAEEERAALKACAEASAEAFAQLLAEPG